MCLGLDAKQELLVLLLQCINLVSNFKKSEGKPKLRISRKNNFVFFLFWQSEYKNVQVRCIICAINKKGWVRPFFQRIRRLSGKTYFSNLKNIKFNSYFLWSLLIFKKSGTDVFFNMSATDLKFRKWLIFAYLSIIFKKEKKR